MILLIYYPALNVTQTQLIDWLTQTYWSGPWCKHVQLQDLNQLSSSKDQKQPKPIQIKTNPKQIQSYTKQKQK